MRRGEGGRECGTLGETQLQSVHHRITKTCSHRAAPTEFGASGSPSQDAVLLFPPPPLFLREENNSRKSPTPAFL